MTYYNQKTKKKYYASVNATSSIGCKTVAIVMALTVCHMQRKISVGILMDPGSALQSIPAHCGIVGNKLPDVTANVVAAMSPNLLQQYSLSCCTTIAVIRE